MASDVDRSHRALADRRRVHDRARRQDGSRGRVAEISDGAITGRGECVPYARYGETVAGVVAALEAMRDAIAGGLDRLALQTAMPAGAARNALDCAFWDFEAKASGQAGVRARGPCGAAGRW